ncbi:LytTR family DNA-binding domain-containing protein [Gymnodinialimonas sp.]
MGFDLATPLFFLEHIAIALLVCLVPVALRAYARMYMDEIRAEAGSAVIEQPVMTEAQTAFLRRLDPDKRGYVMRVSADNHQVDVWTDRGGSKLRLRFGDALEELTDFDGTRIHRSHWVAYDSIVAIVPDGRRHTVRLSCGSELPVSQNGLRALQEAGVSVAGRPN